MHLDLTAHTQHFWDFSCFFWQLLNFCHIMATIMLCANGLDGVDAAPPALMCQSVGKGKREERVLWHCCNLWCQLKCYLVPNINRDRKRSNLIYAHWVLWLLLLVFKANWGRGRGCRRDRDRGNNRWKKLQAGTCGRVMKEFAKAFRNHTGLTKYMYVCIYRQIRAHIRSK